MNYIIMRAHSAQELEYLVNKQLASGLSEPVWKLHGDLIVVREHSNAPNLTYIQAMVKKSI